MRIGRGICFLLLVGVLLTVTALQAQPEVDYSGPADPQQFHDQEFVRLAQALSAQQGHVTTSEQADYDVLYYHLALDLRGYYTHTISGAVTILARSEAPDLTELVLDLCSALTVDSVICGGGLQPFTSSDNILHANLDRTYGIDEIVEAQVYYHGTPCQTNTPYTSVQFYDRPVSGNYIPTEATLSEPYGARDWWPSKNVLSDKADSVRVSLIVADTLTATSNGVLESLDSLPPSSRMFTWVERHPISTYLVSFCATNYTQYTDHYVTLAGDTMPIINYPYPERLTQALTSWNVIPAMMSFCAQTLGEYPFVDEKYGHTMFSFSGAMEHQTNTSYGRNITTNSHTYDYIVQHELFHQWFGDQVTLETWPDVWLNEGFATYGEALWFEHLGGFAAYRSYMITPGDLAVTDPSGPVYNPTELFNSNSVYNKGAWILHMLRGVVRDDSLFFAALREYRARHAYGNATTADFLADVSDVIGYDVTPYLYNYLYLTNRPQYGVSYGSMEVADGVRTVVRLRQMQTITPPFRARLDLRFADGVDTMRMRIENASQTARYYATTPFIPATLTVDPDNWVLKQVTFEPLLLTIMDDTLPAATEGEPYQHTLAAIGGNGVARTWVAPPANLPPNLSLTPDGVLEGTPLEAGIYRIPVKVVDDQLAVDKVLLTLRVLEHLEPPGNLTAYLREDNLLGLRWLSSAGADSYRVYREVLAGDPNLQLILTTADTFAVDTLAGIDADSLAHRFYEVKAVRQ